MLTAVVFLVCVTLSSQSDWMYKFSPTKHISSQLSIECELSDQIWIGWAHYGTRNTSTNVRLPDESDCWMNFTEKIAEQCNGWSECELSSQPTYIHKCAKISDYLYVTYKCIKQLNTFDICQHSRKTFVDSSDHFFIKSSQFPDEYAPNLDCSCSISSPSHLNLKYDILWFSLQDNDYLKVHSQNLSGWISPTHEIGLTSKHSQVRFTTDDSLAYKGFWLRVGARKTCQHDWQLVGDSCIKVFAEELDWRSANLKCSQMNGNLLKLDDVVSDLKLTQYMNAFHPGINSYWIGLRKYVDQHNQEKWMWSSNSTIYNDMSWWPWRKLSQYEYAINSNCVHKRKNEDGYFTTSCDSTTKNSFICQTSSFAPSLHHYQVDVECGKTLDIRPGKNSIKNVILPFFAKPSSHPNIEYAKTTMRTSTVAKTKSMSTSTLFRAIVNDFGSLSSAQPMLVRQSEKLTTTVVAGIISGVGLVIIIVNLAILFVCRRNLKSIIKKSKQSTGDDMIQDYFEAFNTLHSKSLRGTLVQPKSDNVLSMAGVKQDEAALFYPGQFGRELDMRQSAFKPFSKDQIQDVQRLLNQSQYDKMNHQLGIKNRMVPNESSGQYAHTYESVDTLELARRNPTMIGIRNYRANQDVNLLQSPHSADLSDNTNNLSTSTNLSSSSAASSGHHFFKPQNLTQAQLAALIQNSKNLVSYPCDNMLIGGGGEWSPDSAYYSSIPNYATFNNQSFNNVIKNENTLRERLPIGKFLKLCLEKVVKLSIEYKQNDKRFNNIVTIELNQTSGYNWDKRKINNYIEYHCLVIVIEYI
ncbi:neuropilin and tolloid 2 [Brachionus plicatilis]|uniref:Neuropilin and tolloid 2 n=1 Tax=Brachionus plicatilis TaxID=10195 RepID=A0A3M7SDI1_BRAPC|nr:neuropilin and tolloid 2 [Brachionus plicatilis]